MEIEGSFYPLRLKPYDLAWIEVNVLDKDVVRAAEMARHMTTGQDRFLPCCAEDLIVGMMVKDFENRKKA